MPLFFASLGAGLPRCITWVFLCFLGLSGHLLAQSLPKVEMHGHPIASIGPSVFSCRVTDLAVNPDDPTQFYVAYASGGLWFTDNNGTSFRPVFDYEERMTIGAIAVDWTKNVLWVGTGEVNSSRSSYAGNGMYKSTDGGKTWSYRGLPESHHIGGIVLDANNPDRLWVAVLGHLYSKNVERGVFYTDDGGTNWQHTLALNDSTGVVDIIADPIDANTLYAAAWERHRTAWNFSGAGKSSGIWKSTDGGLKWSLLTKDGSGFPTGEKIGRIGLAAGHQNGKTVLYACLDNQNAKTKKADALSKTQELSKDSLRTMTKATFLQLDDSLLTRYLRTNEFPEKYTVAAVKERVKSDKIHPSALVDYLEDANNNLFETDFIGAEVYRSEDGGVTWVRTHQEPLEQINFTYGYYFSTIYCHPTQPEEVYLLGFLIVKSEDGGKNWESINGDNVHVDHHALWLNTKKKGHLINGNDGGVNMSYDGGKSWSKLNSAPVGQLYAVAVDNADPYNVFGGAQDNGVWVGPNDYEPSSEWHQTGAYPYKEIIGGDGMQIAVDTRDNAVIYTGYQFGNYFRINRYSRKTKPIAPKHELGERPLRFNWQTPIHLSIHNQDILYMGANKVYRSMNQGDTWTAISEDLTLGGRKGNVPFGTLTSLHESPLKFGLLYVGSDDGLVHVSKDGGDSWTNISAGLPTNKWVSRVQASVHERGRVYVSLNDYRNDNFSPYLYVSDNYGATWKQLGNFLPNSSVNVVREDVTNQDVLYVGTDNGLYASIDRGAEFFRLADSLPFVPVHDLVLHAKSKELIVGTHGRSIYKTDVSLLQKMTKEVTDTTLYVFDINYPKYSKAWGKKLPWRKMEEPEMVLTIFSKNGGEIDYTIGADEKQSWKKGKLSLKKGLNRVVLTPDVDFTQQKKYYAWLERQAEAKKVKNFEEIMPADNGKIYLRAGKYVITCEQGATKVQKAWLVE